LNFYSAIRSYFQRRWRQVGSVFSKILIEKSFYSGFKNTESLIRTVCGSELQTDGAENRKARLEKSVLSWTVGPAAGWQMNVKFGCRHAYHWRAILIRELCLSVCLSVCLLVTKQYWYCARNFSTFSAFWAKKALQNSRGNTLNDTVITGRGKINFSDGSSVCMLVPVDNSD